MDGLFGRATEKVQAELRRLREMQEPGMRCTPMVDDERRHFTVHFFQDQQQMVPLGDAELRLARDTGAVQGYPWVPQQLKLAGAQRLVEPWCDTASGEIDVRKMLGSWAVVGLVDDGAELWQSDFGERALVFPKHFFFQDFDP